MLSRRNDTNWFVVGKMSVGELSLNPSKYLHNYAAVIKSMCTCQGKSEKVVMMFMDFSKKVIHIGQGSCSV